MKTENHSIDNVLAKNATSFFIPPFQRSYAWGKPEIERYFSDVLNIIGSELDTKEHDKLQHFFGTLVIKEESSGFANKSVVVDGQQRLTTTLLFLIALRDSETDETNQNFITDSYLKNNSSTFPDKIKLQQVTKDWDAYRSLVNKTDAKQGIINNAYQIFTKLITETKKTKPEIQFNHYITAIRRMNVAVIFLDERPFKGEDPQIIFETLNSLGKPLTLSDLIRNFVLLKMDSKSQEDIYEKTWHPKIESVLNDSTSEFFRDYLQYKTNSSVKAVSDNNTKEVYQLFKDFVKSEFDSRHEGFIKDIVRYVNWYRWIITEVVTDSISNDNKKNLEIIELTRNIFHDIKAEAFKPFVLGLFEHHQDPTKEHIDDDLLISILKTIRTYLIRRRILRLSQGENKTIVLMSNRIEALAKGSVSMIELLTVFFYKMRFPNDNEIKTQLLAIDFYEELKKYSKFILGKIEENNAKVAVPFRDSKITIEHVMPQKLNYSWEAELGANFKNIHNKYLHNIGNLILTEFNSEITNKPFADKKARLSRSSLNYRLDVIDKNVWNEASIQEHQRNMIAWFLETFPLPEDYRKKPLWDTKLIESTTAMFSPLDNDARQIGESNKPLEMYIDNNKIKVKTWQDVFILFILYVKNNPTYNFDSILDNQSILFGNDKTIITWATLKLLIDSRPELADRYKTFDGKTCEKFKNIPDGVWFVHINIAASRCLSRIANVMNKYGMPENYVEIVLK